jgi:hypothetical protein
MKEDDEILKLKQLSMVPKEMVPTYCAWCKIHMSGPDTKDYEHASHGICPECFEKFEREYKQSLGNIQHESLMTFKQFLANKLFKKHNA